MNKSLRITVLVFLVVSLIFASSILYNRYKIENNNKSVAITLDYNEVVDMATISKKPIDSVLADFKNVGANSAFLEMDTLRNSLDKGKTIVLQNNTYLISKDYDIHFIKKLFANVKGVVISDAGDKIILKYDQNNINGTFIETLPIGFSVNALNNLRKSGYTICVRVPSFDGANETDIDVILSYLKANKINQIVFSGDTIIGYKTMLKYLANKMKENEIYFGRIEFSKQKGDPVIAKFDDTYTIQVHSITAPEMDVLSEVSIIERYTRAVRERGIRLIFVKMFEKVGDKALDTNLSYVSKIKNNIEKAGYTVGTPKKIETMPNMLFAKVWVSIAVGLLFFILINSLFTITHKNNIILLISSMIFSIIFAIGLGITLKLLTLLLAIITPVLAVVLACKCNKNNSPFSAYKKVFYVFLITLYGGIINAALLSTNDYMARNEIFAGIKLAHFLPLVLVAFILGYGLNEGKKSVKDTCDFIKSKTTSLMQEPLLLGYMVVGVIILAVVGVMLLRSGNDGGVGVSPIELRLRAILDQIVYVRPRTKEFLIGYPCLLIGFWYFIKSNKKIVANILLTIGTIGLVSLFNTFCHIHTPIELSVLRAINGLWCGVLVGSAILIIMKKSKVK